MVATFLHWSTSTICCIWVILQVDLDETEMVSLEELQIYRHQGSSDGAAHQFPDQ